MKINVETTERYVLISVEGSLTIENLVNLETVLKEKAHADKHILLDLAKLSFIDSSSIRIIIQYFSEIKKKGREMCVADINSEIAEVFSITQIDKMIRVFKTREDALAFIISR